MTIRFLGTGTSQGVPVIGCQCKVCQSDDRRDQRLRTAISVESTSTHLVIDAGPDFRQQMLSIGANHLEGVLITHCHNDHIAGLDDVRPFNFMQKSSLAIYADQLTAKGIRTKFDYIFSAHPYPGAPRIELKVHEFEEFIIGDLKIQPLHVLHGQLPISAYRIGELAYITDANELPEDTIQKIKGVKVLVINALRYKPHHSHFTLSEAIEVAEEVEAEKTYFTHISHDLGTYKEVVRQLPDQMFLAYDQLKLRI